ncbi:hypothetical protein DFH09DRAFT_1130502 [Mycena vulgaris]|nr:hypothetical protein DFH09DRAFT_1130502 [Mycena vulgaris]
MSAMDTTLRFSYSNAEEIRTFRAYKQVEAVGGTTELELYQFYHSPYGPSSGVTTFQRMNLKHISWTSNSNATVHFGVNEVSEI